jgi:predicted kinase
LWLDAPASVLVDRTEHRTGDASDAHADIVRRQLGEGAGPMHWHRIDASSAAEVVLKSAAALIPRP